MTSRSIDDDGGTPITPGNSGMNTITLSLPPDFEGELTFDIKPIAEPEPPEPPAGE